jgi:aminomethyltransferase
MGKQTALYEAHVAAKGKIVDFGGWDMPLHYGSQIEEHHIVRKTCGMFDVSHMTIIDFRGKQVREFLRKLLANDVDRLKQPGKALYSCMLNADGGVIDDLIVYYINDEWYRMVVNAATRDKDLAWITEQASGFEVTINERDDLSMIAVQGPAARDKVHDFYSSDAAAIAELNPFFVTFIRDDIAVARTGYTGEDGYPETMPSRYGRACWNGALPPVVWVQEIPCDWRLV